MDFLASISRVRKSAQREIKRMFAAPRDHKLVYAASACEYAEIGAGLAFQAARMGVQEMRTVSWDRRGIQVAVPVLAVEARAIANCIIAAGMCTADITGR
jgi:hypothetical protein